jgi:tetratricopeptide (TPR) repeat protein
MGTLRSRMRLARVLPWVVAVGALLTLGILGASSVGLVCVVLGVPLLAYAPHAGRRAVQWIVQRDFVRLNRLLEAEQFDAALALARELREAYAGSNRATESIRVHEATILCALGNHREAVALFDSIDRRHFTTQQAAWMLNNLAWALARAGAGPRAVSIAHESIEALGKAPDAPLSQEDLRACQLGTLGAALVVAGNADEAVAPLEQALARGGSARQQAARAFYLGEALNALGQMAGAREAWRRAVAAKTPENNEFRRLAEGRLHTPSGSPWR